MSYQPETPILAQGPNPRGLIWVEGWCGMWYEKCHIITYLSYTSMRLSSYLWELIVFRNWDMNCMMQLGKKNPVRSVFVINVSLFTSVVCYCQNGLRRKHGKCSLCNEWWHSFMNQRLNHLVFCIKSVTLEGLCNKNVDIIWHYCIIQLIKECHHSLHNEHFPCFLRNPFWQ
jgi:hypothetical protein